MHSEWKKVLTIGLATAGRKGIFKGIFLTKLPATLSILDNVRSAIKSFIGREDPEFSLWAKFIAAIPPIE